MISRRFLLGAAAAVAMTCGGSVAAPAQTEIQWWHAMGGQLGEALNALAEGFNKSQKDYKVVPVYKGTYTETMTGDDRRVPREAAAAYRPGIRGRHGDDDGCQGRDLSRASADGRRRRDVRSQRISAGGLRLLLDDGRQAPVDAVQLLDARPLLQQGSIQEGRPRPRHAAENLVGHGAIREEAPGRRLPVRVHQPVADLGANREFRRVAQHSICHRGERVRRDGHQAHDQRSAACPSRREPRQMAEGEGLRLCRPRG